MATLVNKLNREVKVIIPNMREFRVFYSDNEGVIGMFFKRDWEESTKQEEHWKPSEEQMRALNVCFRDYYDCGCVRIPKTLESLYYDLKKLM